MKLSRGSGQQLSRSLSPIAFSCSCFGRTKVPPVRRSAPEVKPQERRSNIEIEGVVRLPDRFELYLCLRMARQRH
jgi:hypothetical protein